MSKAATIKLVECRDRSGRWNLLVAFGRERRSHRSFLTPTRFGPSERPQSLHGPDTSGPVDGGIAFIVRGTTSLFKPREPDRIPGGTQNVCHSLSQRCFQTATNALSHKRDEVVCAYWWPSQVPGRA